MNLRVEDKAGQVYECPAYYEDHRTDIDALVAEQMSKEFLLPMLPKVVHQLFADEAAAANHYVFHLFIHNC